MDSAARDEASVWAPAVEDSLVLRLETIRIVLDTLVGPFPREGRIWFARGRNTSGEQEIKTRYPLSEAEWSELVKRYPGVQPIELGYPVYLCPPGVELRMPGSGCPIRDHGIVLGLDRVQIDGDSARTSGWSVQYEISGRRTYTWRQGIILVFERVAGGWRLRAVRSRSIT